MASIQDKRSTGRGWVARWRDPEGVQRTKSFARKIDAEKHLTTVEHSKLIGDYVAPAGGKTLFGERWTVWFDTTVNLRPSTRARDESYARSLILPTFARRPLASIDHDAVQSWVAQMVADGKAPATVQRAHQIMGKVMRSAVKARLITRNPCDDTELPKIETEEQRFLTPTEVARLAGAMDDRYRVLILTAAYSGLRAGELFGLRVDRCDTMRAQLDVLEILVEVKGHHHVGPPKTRAGRRRVPIPRFVADELAQHVAGLGPDELVFTAPDGGPMRSSLFRRRFWYPGCVGAGLGEMVTPPGATRERYEGLRFHDLRHTAVAFWIAAGASPTEVAARAGHSSVVTVLDRYGHLLPREDDRVTDALDEMARQAAQSVPLAPVVELRRS